ncbi:uncharacterized protein LOC130780909 isoform X3 [Actinidia eriantha]|uniref:uncharacterized protein LOC130780909 isoform X3 n=1 Tax=Actinidia eriantha TaxID=165200 RepID=UPI0025855C17|nr:uncharacterized protein LOC130780909 isoform X3 [Actinidia eriantha]
MVKKKKKRRREAKSQLVVWIIVSVIYQSTSDIKKKKTSPGSSSLMARYAMESSKQLAAGIINLGDKGYTTLSKYYPDLLSDTPNSPGPSNSGWKGGRLAASEVENAGIVVVKDFISRTVISQFRAHTSPISALCFDPSGTLLVTASVHGNNINIFGIIPSCAQTGSGNQTHDWSSAHMHLYKLHRGITTAVFSQEKRNSNQMRSLHYLCSVAKAPSWYDSTKEQLHGLDQNITHVVIRTVGAMRILLHTDSCQDSSSVDLLEERFRGLDFKIMQRLSILHVNYRPTQSKTTQPGLKEIYTDPTISHHSYQQGFKSSIGDITTY